ncbi:MAG: uracil-DNA glycosylase [Thermotogae bacterium]|nr:uracil-DNA glycosylase [Thermotogota bacterium]
MNEDILRGLGLEEIILKSKNRLRAHEELTHVIENCRRCWLHKRRTRVVVWDGSPFAPIMAVGEAPGRDEDLRGKPFVGRAGQLLTKIIEEAGLNRLKDFYITNILKCRPPNNRDPLPDEIKACSPYLEIQIKLVSPKAFLCLGRYSSFYILGRSDNPTMKELRGKVHPTRYGIPAVCTYHPAAALRNSRLKDLILQDILLLKGLVFGEGGGET